MSSNSSQFSQFPQQSNLVKRVACIRCLVSSRCDRCRKADVECTYVPPKPMGRPKTSRSRQSQQTTNSAVLQSDTMAVPQQDEQSCEQFDLNTMIGDADLALDEQSSSMFFNEILPYDQGDASASIGFALSAREIEFLTPGSSQGSLCFSNGFDTYTVNAPTEEEAALENHARTTPSVSASGGNLQSSMQDLSKIGLDLHLQITKYQKAADNAVLSDLVCDVLHSSTSYLNSLLRLDDTFFSGQSSSFGTDWTDDQPGRGTQLNMSAAFELLIPYVRLVQLHSILHRAMIRTLTGKSCSGSRASATGSAETRSEFPVLSVGGARVDATDSLRARLLLQMSVNLLTEVETTLQLPQDARVCRPEIEGGMGPAEGVTFGEQGSCSLLRKAMSARLLKTILEERDLGGDDVQSMRERVAYIKCLLRSSRQL
ncbi:hypothetical protein C7974DRAFT_461421 [Boeremia exigua]|uniref:uncharacterized protein n=1 Tax=Boeremia exigua TaxID=749465 RepID=UPI001E8D1099|nr:uncharacterized protein C7974DRAFT_461421 [Boeremia exigua]KAH6639119.1 hypothetical protein C7974DRAFT_461421 [Boeremia exigua]